MPLRQRCRLGTTPSCMRMVRRRRWTTRSSWKTSSTHWCSGMKGIAPIRGEWMACQPNIVVEHSPLWWAFVCPCSGSKRNSSSGNIARRPTVSERFWASSRRAHRGRQSCDVHALVLEGQLTPACPVSRRKALTPAVSAIRMSGRFHGLLVISHVAANLPLDGRTDRPVGPRVPIGDQT
jgi:hypothetical protein